MFQKKSKLLLIIVILESILSIWTLFYFNYLDRLNYFEGIFTRTHDVALLIQNLFTSTWWALIVLVLCLISLFSLVSYLYQDLKFQFMAICLWFILFIIGLNFKDNFLNNLSTAAIFIPIIVANIFAYFNHKKVIGLK